MQEIICAQESKFVLAFNHRKASIFTKHSKKVVYYEVSFGVITSSPKLFQILKSQGGEYKCVKFQIRS